ncbi:hypothetical protein MPDQ_002207 [Monascus purpureus]|uniref:Wings apart-like protein C-terminal domain-containing protein n=1 Tax=Monascus purpureus TaxID=5098 RepID=A0A507QKT3_MONPU|nr:hypothetical protein MPDQ_002207 [Monascus purpureus]
MNIHEGKEEPDKQVTPSSPLLPRFAQNADPKLGSPSLRTHRYTLVNPYSADPNTPESLSESDKRNPSASTQRKRKLCMSEEPQAGKRLSCEADASSRRSSSPVFHVDTRETFSGSSKTMAAVQQRKDHDNYAPPIPDFKRVSFETPESKHSLPGSGSCKQPIQKFDIPRSAPNDFAFSQRSGPEARDVTPSDSPLGTTSAPDETSSNRKRLVDSLVAYVQPVQNPPSPDANIESRLTSVDLSDFHTTRRKAPPCIPSQSSCSGSETDIVASSQESASFKSSHLRGSTVTYARQRSFLGDISIMSDVGDGGSPGPSQAGRVTGNTTVAIDPCASSSVENSDNNCTGSVRSIHELRKAGENARFIASVDSIFEDIEDVQNSVSGRCGGFIQLCEKLLNFQFARCFAQYGFDKRLMEDLTDHLDNLSATFALCAYELICSCGSLSSVLFVPFWSKILNISPRLLNEENDVLTLAKRRDYGLSKHVQASIYDILPRLCSGLSKNQIPIQISPRLLALRCLHLTVSTLQEHGCNIDNIPLSLFTQLVGLLLLEGRSGVENRSLSTERLQILTLGFSILETYTLISGSLANGYQNAILPLSRLYGLLSLKGYHGGRNFQISTLYMRVILNVTNSNPSLAGDFATPNLVGELVRTVVAEFSNVSEDPLTRQNASLDTVILALGSLINLTEESESSRRIFLGSESNSESLIHVLLLLFTSSIGSTSEANSVLEVNHNVAVGYLSILLTILCLETDVRYNVRRALNGKGLPTILSTVDEFLVYHQKVDQDSPSLERRGETMATFMIRLRDIIAKVRHSERLLQPH